MDYKKVLTGIAAGLLLYAQAGFSLANAAVPLDAPKDIKYIVGFYYGNGENILIRENNGNLELLYRFAMSDKSFAGANIYPLTKQHFDSYTLTEAGPMAASEANVKFERDQDGYGISCRVGGHLYSRGFLGHGTGERAKAFRLPEITAEKWTELRNTAANAVEPQTLIDGTQAQLVDVATIPGVKVNSVYATTDNCFGAALYTSPKLFISKEVAVSLANVQKVLAAKGYGLVVWDAYRPWSVSKLANLALPDNGKDMLEDPETKGSPHNTGHAVDVGLYDLTSGVEVEMTSGFDEPSLRQFASYAGGTTRQRYLRELLRKVMTDNGFNGIEMEWWHFEHQALKGAAHLNIPLENIH